MNQHIIFSQFRGLARTDSPERVRSFLTTLGAKECEEAVRLIHYLIPKASLVGINELGAYILALPDVELTEAVTKEAHNGFGCCLVNFVAKHDHERVGRLCADWHSTHAEIQAYCCVEAALCELGFNSAVPALVRRLETETDAGRALSWAKALMRVNPSTYREIAMETAFDAMEDPWHIRSAFEWLIEVIGTPALAPVIAALEHIDTDRGLVIAKHAVALLGVEAEPMFELALRRKTNDVALGVVMGVVESKLPIPRHLTQQVFDRLLATASDEALPMALASLARWDRDQLIKLKLDDHPNQLVQGSYKAALQLATTAYGEGWHPPITATEFETQIRQPPLAAWEAELHQLAKPCLRIHTIPASGPVAAASSKFGGVPDVAHDFEWPRSRDGQPFSFVARLAQDDLRLIDPGFEGSLLFFAAVEQCGCEGAVIRVHQPNIKEAKLPGDLYHDLIECDLQVFGSVSLPNPADEFDRWRFDPALLSDVEAMEAYRVLLEASYGSDDQLPLPVAFGEPHYCQGNPKFSAEQRFTRLRHDSERPNDYAASLSAEFLENSARWISLLSSWTNERAGLRFHDTGTLSFLITEQDFRARDFSKVIVMIDYM